jgi:hypothetical protein
MARLRKMCGICYFECCWPHVASFNLHVFFGLSFFGGNCMMSVHTIHLRFLLALHTCPGGGVWSFLFCKCFPSRDSRYDNTTRTRSIN